MKYAEIKKVLKIKYVSRLMGVPSMTDSMSKRCPEMRIRNSMAIDHCYDAVMELRKRLDAIKVDIVKAVK